jgi:hypothetical protein
MKPIAAAVAGALISGVAMYTVGAKTATVDAFSQSPGLVQTADGQYVPANQLVTAQPATVSARPAIRTAAPRRTVYRAAAPAAERVVVREEAPEGRSWKKSAMIIGGTAASGAGVGAIVDGKKGALIGAAIGGGAASIYEAAKRH